MARYTGPITKKSRRLKVDLVGGDKNFELRPFPPGQHGRRRIQEKEYLTQLQEKQKARFTYGVMEKQFIRYYKAVSYTHLDVYKRQLRHRLSLGRPG